MKSELRLIDVAMVMLALSTSALVVLPHLQVRAKAFAPDFARGWGRATVAWDYAYDTPHLPGTMRTGLDLTNIGARQPSDQWHLGHLYQPRAYMPGSTMPRYPYLFEIKPTAEPGKVVVNLPMRPRAAW